MRTPVVHVLLASLLAAGSAAQEERGADRISSKSLQHLKEGRAHAREGRYPRALGDLRVAVALAERAPGTKLILALALHNLAEVYRLNGERVNALQAYRRALRIYEDLNHTPAMTIAQTRISALLNTSDAKAATRQTSKPVSSTATPAAEKRIDEIDKAVERIRKRLRSSDAPPPAARSSMGPGSIELSKPGVLAMKPGQMAYADAVKQRIHRGWRYPNPARNKHQEGTVEVEFSILSNGEIESITILKSSGFLPLDMESIRSIRESAPFGPVALPRGQDQIDLRLLFKYALPVPEANKFKAQAPASPTSHQ